MDATNIDGQNNATITDGDTVATWKDLSSAGIIFDQSQSNKPSLITDGGMNYVAFNQSSDNNEHLYANNVGSFLNGHKKFAIFIVQKLDSLDDTDIDTMAIHMDEEILIENNSHLGTGYRFLNWTSGSGTQGEEVRINKKADG